MLESSTTTADKQQQQQQQQGHAASFIAQNTSNSMQDPLQGNKSSQTQLDIKRSGSQHSTKGREEWFTGTAHRPTLSAKRSGTCSWCQCHI